MPVISVHRYGAAAAGPSFDGAQFIDGDLVISSAPATKPVVKLTQAVYPVTQSYVLFQYTGNFNGSLSDLTVDDSELALSQVAEVTHDTVKKQIIVRLQSRATNGTQYIDGDLNIAGSTTFVMPKSLFKTPGTYVLFDVTGSIIAGSLANLTVSPPSGLSLDPAQSPNPFIDGNQIKVTLI